MARNRPNESGNDWVTPRGRAGVRWDAGLWRILSVDPDVTHRSTFGRLMPTHMTFVDIDRAVAEALDLESAHDLRRELAGDPKELIRDAPDCAPDLYRVVGRLPADWGFVFVRYRKVGGAVSRSMCGGLTPLGRAVRAEQRDAFSFRNTHGVWLVSHAGIWRYSSDESGKPREDADRDAALLLAAARMCVADAFDVARARDWSDYEPSYRARLYANLLLAPLDRMSAVELWRETLCRYEERFR